MNADVLNQSNFGRVIKQYLSKFGLKSKIYKLNWHQQGNSIVGNFVGKAANELKLFDYTITPNGLEFEKSQVQHSDSYFHGLALQNSNINPLSSSKTYYLDGQKNCVKSLRCGASCIELRDKCRVEGGEAARIGAKLIGLANEFNPPEHSQKLKQKLAQVESEIRAIPTHEEFVAVGQDGKIIARIPGDSTHVMIPYSLKDKLKGQVVTHNHPTWRYYPDDPRLEGRSLSHPDLVFAASFEVGEVRAVAPGYKYSLKPGEKGWGSEGQINSAYTKHSVFTHWDLTQKIRSGEITAEEADRDFQGEIVKRVASEMGWKYQETKTPISKAEKAKAKKLTDRKGPMQLPGSGETATIMVERGLAPFVQGLFITAAAATVYAELKDIEERERGKRKDAEDKPVAPKVVDISNK